MTYFRLVGRGAFLITGMVGLAMACGSRSSDDLDLPEVAGSAGAIGGGLNTGGGTTNGGGSAISTGGDLSRGGVSSGGETSAAGGAGAELGGTGGTLGTAGHSGGGLGGVSSAGAAGAAGKAGASGAGGRGGAAGTGSTAAGGASGSAGSPGTGGRPATCPATAPNMNATCNEPALTCPYVGERCTCQQQGARNNLDWRCTGNGNACPAAMPADQTACRSKLQCPYPNGDQCNCRNGQWNCLPAGCPVSKPTAGENCAPVTGQCTYGNAAACICVAGTWFCD
jgi:hypothetical protein